MGEKIVDGFLKNWKAVLVIAAVVAGVLTWQGLPARVKALEGSEATQNSRLDRLETKVDVQFENIKQSLERIEKKVDRK
jgi:outer membrane murein-binding lipoprotein Lpp